MKEIFIKKLLITSVATAILVGGSSLTLLNAQAQGTDPEQAVKTQTQDERGQQGRQGRKWPIIEEAAAVLGVNKDVLVNTLKSGKSIVEAAAEKGISEADLTAKLQQIRSGNIDVAVKDGKLTAEQGDHMKQKLGEHLKFILNEKNLLDESQGHGKWHGHGLKPDTEKLAKSLGLSKDELHAQLKTGKSLAEIAQAKGVSKDKLVASIKEQLTPSIEKWVDHKKDGKKKE
ncbi:hypothetical protein [Paenibacillus sp. N3.4]|uniref:hypothetical protein n=1 Tax=Paenibacillus sp. N3.4 TaxID=2603222 RepID=UPI0011C7E62A|nr:hypothetical protein [Paenibacillus sp. N3.4]TXK85782.1 hypothetical protein FU659_02435 [Paenibacillus sp. N3.4]